MESCARVFRVSPHSRTDVLRSAISILLWCLICTSGLFSQASGQAQVELRIIVVESATQANRILDRLRKGDDFAAVAKEVSVDPTASDGGYMGRLDPATLRPELRNALQGVEPGKFTAAVHTSSGYAILKVVSPGESTSLQNTAPARILPSSAADTIRYAPNVGGKGEADLAYRNFPKPDGWNQSLRAMCDIRQESLAQVISHILKSLDPANPDGVAQHGRPLDLIQMHYALAN